MHAVPLAWHYTILPVYKLIVDSGVLRPADCRIELGERPILWFSTNPFWEQTANKMLFDSATGKETKLSMVETAQKAGGLVRFAVPVQRLVRWPRLGQLANIKSKTRKILEEAGIRMGADYRQWYGTLESIPTRDCLAIESMDLNNWQWIDDVNHPS